MWGSPLRQPVDTKRASNASAICRRLTRVRREGEEIAGVFPPAASLHQTGFPQPGHYPAYPDRVGADILCQRFAVEGFRLMVEENQGVNAENKIAVQKPSPLYFVL